MGKLVDWLKEFNSYSDSQGMKCGAEEAEEYLDKKHPEWRELIKDRTEWKAVFEFGVHVKPDAGEEFVKLVFDCMGEGALSAAWNDPQAEEDYRIYAGRSLAAIDRDRYLPEYVRALKMMEFNPFYVSMNIMTVFNFPGAVDVAIEMYSKPESRFAKSTALEFLEAVSGEHWNEYSESVKTAILEEDAKAILAKCTENTWRNCTLSDKVILTHEAVVNEYRKFYEMLEIWRFSGRMGEFHLFSVRAKSLMPCHDRSCFMYEKALKKLKGEPDAPEMEFDARVGLKRYAPSALLWKFYRLTDNAEDALLHGMISRAMRELRYITLNRRLLLEHNSHPEE